MSKHRVTCPECSAKLTVESRLMGKEVNCPGCDKRMMLPQLATQTEDDELAFEDFIAPDLSEWCRESMDQDASELDQRESAHSGHQQVSTTVQDGSKRSSTRLLMLVISFSGLFLFSLTTVDWSSEPDSSNTRLKAPDINDAFFMAQQFVEDELKSPSTASYGWQIAEETVTDLGASRFQVNFWVDAENSFGANIRNNVRAVVRHNSEDNWSLESLEFQ